MSVTKGGKKSSYGRGEKKKKKRGPSSPGCCRRKKRGGLPHSAAGRKEKREPVSPPIGGEACLFVARRLEGRRGGKSRCPSQGGKVPSPSGRKESPPPPPQRPGGGIKKRKEGERVRVKVKSRPVGGKTSALGGERGDFKNREYSSTSTEKRYVAGRGKRRNPCQKKKKKEGKPRWTLCALGRVLLTEETVP